MTSGSTFQPPIHLDPSQNPSQQTAFINQNFQTIASILETNSFRIVKRGNTAISSTGSTINWVTVPHNLGFAPVPFVFLNDISRTAGTTVITGSGNIAFPTWSSLTLDTIKSSATNSGNALPIVAFQTFFDAVADETNLYIFLYNATGSSISAFNVGYYLIQQAATN